jgi:hypothetical protein
MTSMIGTRHECQCCARIATIVDVYDDGGGEHGYIYTFDGEPGQRWISTKAASIRFRRIGDDKEGLRKALQASNDALRFLKGRRK